MPAIDLRDTFRSVNLDDVQADAGKDIHPNSFGNSMIFDNLLTKLQKQPNTWLTLTGPSCPIASSALAAK
ncbi:MAG: hypothetical protein LAN37_00145 [Acidobacteriia bacterium]|nr:hypothetical protein [Terriglobia bacterium]